MSEKRRLIFSIVQFLNRELSSTDNSHSEDAKESLEVSAGLANLLTIYFLHFSAFHIVRVLPNGRTNSYG